MFDRSYKCEHAYEYIGRVIHFCGRNRTKLNRYRKGVSFTLNFPGPFEPFVKSGASASGGA
jgi:hypothetical protein